MSADRRGAARPPAPRTEAVLVWIVMGVVRRRARSSLTATVHLAVALDGDSTHQGSRPIPFTLLGELVNGRLAWPRHATGVLPRPRRRG